MSAPDAPLVTVPDELRGIDVDFGTVTVTAETIAAYVDAVGAPPSINGEAPGTFCVTLRRGMTPPVPVPANAFTVYGGHDLHFFAAIRAGQTYRITARITDAFEKSGRSGRFAVIMREANIATTDGRPVARIIERQIVRPRPVH